jgi:uncharacterized membrane protein YbaN (DUF454 family)
MERAEGPQDHSAQVRKHDSLVVRVALLGLGTLFVLLGLIGAFLPLLPTTPFLLLAAACYARASTRFYNWLLNNRTFGPLIREWRAHRSLPWRVKVTAIAMMSLTLGASIVFFVQGTWLKIALTAFGVLLAVYMARIPSRDRPPPA